MTLSEQARERLADIVELQPTKNAELQQRWGMDSGSEVHAYLESELKDYYFRDDNSLIRATEEAAELVDVEPGVTGGEEPGAAPSAVNVPGLQAAILDLLAGPEDPGQSVVSVLQSLRAETDYDPDVDEVREALQSLRRKSVVEVVYTTVPTFRLAVPRDEFEVTRSD
ncbi:DUF5797 family protein [Haloarchaeobius sp. HRN-SO-5]|uniref:DUF5797 family protein n=1 Tax=Haloarchaeobius sp. HRN-SO-5 TaxID=3446118 RepID=UPI003EB88AE2